MSKDFNSPRYPSFEKDPGNNEGHLEEGGGVILSNVKDEEHPYFSPKGMLGLINNSRNAANSIKEKELKGEIKPEVVEGIILASRKTKLPIDLLIFAMDWEKDMTSRTDGSDAEAFAKKILNSVPQLRSTLGRDPMLSEIFAGFIFGSAQKVKELIENAEKKPKEEVKPFGTKKDEILMKKNRNDKEKIRTNEEMYGWFSRRMNDGNNTFKSYVMDKPYDSPEDKKQMQDALDKATMAAAQEG